MEERVLEELKKLGVKDLEKIELNELSGDYVNAEVELPDGTIGKLLDDNKKYMCTQIEVNEDFCYGVATDENIIAIYSYGKDGINAKLEKVIYLNK
ncbi:MAG: hypothetical protein Q4G05_01375 [Clostridia bacterium]|nr:hypothetical protein [Clostridia bacterium]